MFEDQYGDTLVARLVRAGTPPPDSAKVFVAYMQFLMIKAEMQELAATRPEMSPCSSGPWA